MTMTLCDIKYARDLRAGDRLRLHGRIRQANDAGDGRVEIVQFSAIEGRIVSTIFDGDEPITLV